MGGAASGGCTIACGCGTAAGLQPRVMAASSGADRRAAEFRSAGRDEDAPCALQRGALAPQLQSKQRVGLSADRLRSMTKELVYLDVSGQRHVPGSDFELLYIQTKSIKSLFHGKVSIH